jgi:hypothetical protein
MRFSELILVSLLSVLLSCSDSNNGTDDGKGGEPSRFGKIEGTVSDIDTGKGIQGVDVTLTKVTETTPFDSEITNSGGYYEFSRLDAGKYTLRLTHEGYEPESIPIEVRSNQEANGSKKMTPIEIPSVQGVIKDVNGNALSDAYVYLIPTKNTAKVEVNNGTDDDGKFSFTGLSNGETYRLFVFKDGYKGIADREVTVPNTEVNLQMTVRTSGNVSFDKVFMDFGETTDIAALNIKTEDNTNKTWQLASDADWISFDTNSGAGDASIILEIDRNYLSGKNSERIARIIVTGEGDSDEMWVIVSGAGAGIHMGDIITLSAKDITSNSAIISSMIVAKKLKENAKQIGVCYSHENSLPTYEQDYFERGELSAISSDGEYVVTLTTLESEKKYYYRSYVIDEDGKMHYSPNVRDFSTKTEVIPPIIFVSSATNIKSTSATLNATIDVSGSTPVISEIGFCYSRTNDLPTIHDTRRFVEKAQYGDYRLDIDGLDYKTKYHVRGYAIQNGTPVYSKESVSFKTSWVTSAVQTFYPENIGASSATLRGSIDETGDPIYSERGFCINKIGNPTIIDKKVVANSDEDNYFLNITNLDYRTSYYVKAYVIQGGEPIYGNLISFPTIWEDAVVSTYAVTEIEAKAATFNGVINKPGQPECYEYGFVYSPTNTNPTIGDSRITCSGDISSYSKVVTGLTENQRYYVRAYAIQPGQSEPVYGTVQPFTTGTPPIIQTLEVDEVWKINQINGSYLFFANLYGKVIEPGSASYVERGFVYKIEDILFNTPPVYENDFVVKSPNEGTFTMVTYQLNHMEWYVVRAYVKTASGTIYYGNPVTFDTWTFTEF